MKRIALMVLRLFYAAPFWFYKICKYGKDDHFQKYSREERYRLLQQMTCRATKAGRIDIVSSGLENIPKEDGFVVFPNHQGLFDGLVFFQTLGHPFATIMKKETKNIFLLKQIRILVGGILIDREDIRQSMKVILEMARRVQDGENFVIFAEGTRSRNGNELLEFKGGSFKSATKARCPIVPAALIDSYKAFDTHSIEKITVQVHYLTPIYYEEYKDLKSQEIASLVQSRIKEAIKENTGL